jgi:hypothetical protein
MDVYATSCSFLSACSYVQKALWKQFSLHRLACFSSRIPPPKLGNRSIPTYVGGSRLDLKNPSTLVGGIWAESSALKHPLTSVGGIGFPTLM